jgi:hypothetical protein
VVQIPDPTHSGFLTRLAPSTRPTHGFRMDRDHTISNPTHPNTSRLTRRPVLTRPDQIQLTRPDQTQLTRPRLKNMWVLILNHHLRPYVGPTIEERENRKSTRFEALALARLIVLLTNSTNYTRNST